MLGEYPNRSVTKIESQDVDFLEGDFPTRGEVDKNLGFYDMNEPDQGTQIPIEIESNSIPSESVLLDAGSQDPQQRKSKRVSIPHCHFEIKGKAFM